MSKCPKYLLAVLAAACCLPAAGLGAAEKAALRPVAFDPADGHAYPTTGVSGILNDKPPPGAGALGAKAVVGTITRGGLTVRAAVDFTRPGAERPDVALLDFSGAGKFDARRRMPLTATRESTATYYRATFGPAVLPAERDGRTFPVCVRGLYYHISKRHRLYFHRAAALAGPCRFGNKTLTVRFVDQTGNFRFDDAASVTYGRYGPPQGDWVEIGSADGSFGGAAVRAYYGQPVFVHGAWYDVTISSDGRRAVARPAKVAAGRLSVPNGRWEATLEKDGRALVIRGGAEPAAVPAGTYHLVQFRQWSAAGGKDRPASVVAGLIEFARKKCRTLTVAEGRATKLEVGGPMSAKLSARPYGTGSIRLGMARPVLHGGLSVTMLTPSGRWIFSRPDPPKLRVCDSTGGVVATVDLAYG